MRQDLVSTVIHGLNGGTDADQIVFDPVFQTGHKADITQHICHRDIDQIKGDLSEMCIVIRAGGINDIDIQLEVFELFLESLDSSPCVAPAISD